MRALRGDRRLMPFLPLWCEHVVRFGFVGVTNTMVNYAFYAANVVFFDLSAALSLLLANLISFTFAFFATGHFVYGKLGGARIIRYALMWIVLYFLNVSLLEFLINHGLGK